MASNEIKLIRFIYNNTETIGVIKLKNRYYFTLENPTREKKIPQKTGIPAGEYNLELKHSPKFSKEYEFIDNNLIPSTKNNGNHLLITLKDVPNFSRILIHWGNSNLDTQGCILVGENFKLIGKKYILTKSRKTYSEIYPEIYRLINEGGCKLKIIEIKY